MVNAKFVNVTNVCLDFCCCFEYELHMPRTHLRKGAQHPTVII